MIKRQLIVRALSLPFKASPSRPLTIPPAKIRKIPQPTKQIHNNLKQKPAPTASPSPMEKVAVSPEAEAIRERDVKNIIATTSEDKLPQTRKEALAMLDGMKQPFHNDDQGYEIYVSHSDAKHTMSYRNIDQIKVVGIVDKVIKNAVKIGEMPVAEDETGTKNIHLFYCPVNIDGKQYSARMVVKEYEKGNFVVDQMNLYNTQLREEKGTDKTPIQQNMPPTVLSSIPSTYKVKELIHNTQEYDRKILGFGENDRTAYSLPGGNNTTPTPPPERLSTTRTECQSPP